MRVSFPIIVISGAALGALYASAAPVPSSLASREDHVIAQLMARAIVTEDMYSREFEEEMLARASAPKAPATAASSGSTLGKLGDKIKGLFSSGPKATGVQTTDAGEITLANLNRLPRPPADAVRREIEARASAPKAPATAASSGSTLGKLGDKIKGLFSSGPKATGVQTTDAGEITLANLNRLPRPPADAVRREIEVRASAPKAPAIAASSGSTLGKLGDKIKGLFSSGPKATGVQTTDAGEITLANLNRLPRPPADAV